MKYIELFKNGFDSTITEKIKPENYPYVGYSPNEGLRLSMIPEENQIKYQMVDLGLPSGLKWADRNVGAENPWDNGLYFSWGNVDGHTVDENGNVTDGYSFDKNTYPTTFGGQYMSSTLDAEHDAATVNMSSEWRIPTIDEINELIENTDRYYIDLNRNIVSISELNGSIKLHSICFVKKDNTFDYNNRSNFIEIPFAGYCGGSLLKDKHTFGVVWSSSINESWTDGAKYLSFDRDGRVDNGGSYRYYGNSIRGVHA
mgnify:CR=1 FL=1